MPGCCHGKRHPSDRYRTARAWAPTGAATGVSRQPVAGGPTAQELADLIAEQPKQTTLTGEGTGPQRDNDIRAGWAARALVAYAQHLGNGSLTEEVETAATDLLSDLRHLFDALGVDWEAAVSSSDDHYRGEIFGQL